VVLLIFDKTSYIELNPNATTPPPSHAVGQARPRRQDFASVE
jgi:hypothetical protein